MKPMVYIIPIESITDEMCPAFKDEFVNNLSEQEVIALATETFTLESFDKRFNADTTGKYSSDRIFIRII